MPRNQLQAGRKVITDVATKILDDAENKVSVVITNLSGIEDENGVTPTPVIVFIDGNSTVSTATAYPIHPGATLSLQVSGYQYDNDLWAVCATGQTATLAIMVEQGTV